MPIIYTTHRLHAGAEAMLAGHAEITVASALDAATLAAEAEPADIVVVRAALPAGLFSRAARLRAAIRHGAGVDMIPIDAATSAGVLVSNLPGSNARSVAELVIFDALALLRRFRPIDRDLRAEGWFAGRRHAEGGRELSGKTIGIVGFGAIGRDVARMAHHGFGLNVLVNSRTPREVPGGTRFVPLEELLGGSDVVVLCCPLTPETTGLLSRQRIAAMKPGAILVNVSRGAVVDDAALLEALRSGALGGAALDVVTDQPLAPEHPYLALDNVIVTPHMAGLTEDSMARMGIGVAEEALRILGGELPVHLRNPEAVERYRMRFG